MGQPTDPELAEVFEQPSPGTFGRTAVAIGAGHACDFTRVWRRQKVGGDRMARPRRVGDARAVGRGAQESRQDEFDGGCRRLEKSLRR